MGGWKLLENLKLLIKKLGVWKILRENSIIFEFSNLSLSVESQRRIFAEFSSHSLSHPLQCIFDPFAGLRLSYAVSLPVPFFLVEERELRDDGRNGQGHNDKSAQESQAAY